MDLLKSRIVCFRVSRYLEGEILREDFLGVLNQLKMRPRDELRRQEKEHRKNNFNKLRLSDDETIDIILKNKRLIERPIVTIDYKAIIARPPEKVRDIY